MTALMMTVVACAATTARFGHRDKGGAVCARRSGRANVNETLRLMSVAECRSDSIDCPREAPLSWEGGKSMDRPSVRPSRQRAGLAGACVIWPIAGSRPVGRRRPRDLATRLHLIGILTS